MLVILVQPLNTSSKIEFKTEVKTKTEVNLDNLSFKPNSCNTFRKIAVRKLQSIT